MVAATNDDCRAPRRGGGGAKVGGKGKKNQGRHKRGVPVGCASPPIREGISLLPEIISHKPPLSSTLSLSLSLMIKKMEGGRLSKSTSTINRHFGLRLHTYFFLIGKLPLGGGLASSSEQPTAHWHGMASGHWHWRSEVRGAVLC
jgi:hypothetical protein